MMGVADEKPPLGKIRESRDPMLLTLFVDLYREQNLFEDGGISQAVCRTLYTKEKVNERAEFDVFGFNKSNTYLDWDTEMVKKHYRDKEDLTEDERRNGSNCTIDFFNRIGILDSLGLIERTIHLFDQEDDGEIIHELSAELDVAARDASMSLLSEHHDVDHYEFLIPLPRHLKEATIVGTYRTTYKPRTNLTGGWYQDTQKRNKLYRDKYTEIVNRFCI